MEISTDTDRLRGRKAKSCVEGISLLNEGERNSVVGRKKQKKENPGNSQGISMTLNLNQLFLELQVVLGPSPAQASL